jgi:hypothetical protein
MWKMISGNLLKFIEKTLKHGVYQTKTIDNCKESYNIITMETDFHDIKKPAVFRTGFYRIE